ncbi:MAG: hypothetical protein CM15mP120_09990 [Pseudomonadota bacterium]|nr:MAG: hypothetical protein CM15mP120_09990 [Pseudomonadota bacterium]
MEKQPELIDAVLMYANAAMANARRFTGLHIWFVGARNLLPIGKAYFGFTDEELTLLDKWVRTHTNQRFGPVRGSK